MVSRSIYVTWDPDRLHVRAARVMFLILLTFTLGSWAERMDISAAILQARCLARCCDKYGVMLPDMERGTDQRSIRICDSYDSCKQCMVPCNLTVSNPDVRCSDICPDADSSCVDSCRFFRDTLVFGNVTDDQDESPKRDSIKDLSVLCKTVPNEWQPCQSDGASVYLGWHVTDDVPKIGGQPETVLYIVTSHLKTRDVDEKGIDICGSPWTHLNIVSDTMAGMEQLRCDTPYRFCVTPVTAFGRYGNAKATPWIRTNGPENQLMAPRSIRYDIVIVRQKPAAKITWDPGDDPSCYYRLYILSLGLEEPMRIHNIKIPRRFEYQIEELAFSVNHTIKLYTYDRTYRNSSPESCDVTFITPDCLVSTSYNFTACAPGQPQNLNLTVLTPDHDDEQAVNVSVSVTWEAPYGVKSPDDILGYTLIYRKEPPVHAARLIEPHHGTVVANSSQREIILPGLHNHNVYRFTLIAESRGGPGIPTQFVDYIAYNSTTLSSNSGLKEYDYAQATGLVPSTKEIKFGEMLIIVLVPVLVVTLIVLIIVCVVIRRKHMFMQRKPSHRFGPVEVNRFSGFEQELNPIYEAVPCHYQTDEPLMTKRDSFEIDYSCLDFITGIGEGAFGKVVKAEFYQKSTDRKKGEGKVVAVKMLKDYHTGDESRSFLREIQAMKSLGHHPYIVSILGCCVTGPKLCLIMDYCALGDLRNYLRKYREKLLYNASSPYGVMSWHHDVIGDHMMSSDSGVSRSSLTLSHKDSTDSSEINETKLLSYARQISIGMEFLEDQRFVHRDLAARNILLFDHRHVKISDFGLSRDVYETNVYQPTSARKLPYKWMAIESLFSQKFTIKSDVWSFGIVLWEIVTLGGSPYPSIPLEDLYGLLNEGYRMEKPENCAPKVYEIMLSAWHPNPHNRPTFFQIRQNIETLLERTQSYIDLSVEVSPDFFSESTADSHGDEKPLVEADPKTPPTRDDLDFLAQSEGNEYVVDIHDQPLLRVNANSKNDTRNTSTVSPCTPGASKWRETGESLPVKSSSHISKTYLPDYRHRVLSEGHIRRSNCTCPACAVVKKRTAESEQPVGGSEKGLRTWSKENLQNLLDKIGQHLLKVGDPRIRKRSVSLTDIDNSTATTYL